jgi:hypothetical protein
MKLDNKQKWLGSEQERLDSEQMKLYNKHNEIGQWAEEAWQ